MYQSEGEVGTNLVEFCRSDALDSKKVFRFAKWCLGTLFGDPLGQGRTDSGQGLKLFQVRPVGIQRSGNLPGMVCRGCGFDGNRRLGIRLDGRFRGPFQGRSPGFQGRQGKARLGTPPAEAGEEEGCGQPEEADFSSAEHVQSELRICRNPNIFLDLRNVSAQESGLDQRFE